MAHETAIRHFIDIADLNSGELLAILDESMRMKRGREALGKAVREKDAPLAGCMLALIFEKPSTRTRVSFDVAMRQMGGDTLMLSSMELQLGRGETIPDTARVLSRMVDAIMIRSGDHDAVRELAQCAEVPVINGLTPRSHPCQIMADLLTLAERKGDLENLVVAWSGDGNNVALSFLQAAARLGFALRFACPKELSLARKDVEWAQSLNASIEVGLDPQAAVEGADCVVTDAWISMGDTDAKRRESLLAPYRVDAALMGCAKDDAIFMHCLPAYRGMEVSEEVLESPQSVVFDEAENRLHAQKGILAWCLGALA